MRPYFGWPNSASVYLVYVDESGTPSYEDAENFVLAAVVVHESRYQAIDKIVDTLKVEHVPAVAPAELELHANEVVWRQKKFEHLNIAEAHELFSETCKVLASSDCWLLAVVIRKDRIYANKKAGFDPLEWAHRLLFERACKLLAKINTGNLAAGRTEEYGILLIDAVGAKHDEKLRKKLLHYYRGGSMFVANKYLIEEPIFVNSKYRNLSQLVDHVAFVVRRVHRTNPKPNAVDTLCKAEYDRLMPKFDKDSNGRVAGCGVKVFP